MTQPRDFARMLTARGVLAAAMVLCAIYLFYVMRDSTLFFDEWSFFADYRGYEPSVLLNPFGGNLEVLPLLVYKAVFELFGPDAFVLRLISIALTLICAGLFFALAAPRAGEPIAATAAVLLLFCGAAVDVVATTLGLTPKLGIAAGLGALLALSRGDRRGDILAGVLIGIGLASNSVALPFAAGAVVLIGTSRPRESWRRLVPIGVAVALYVVWRIWSGGLDPVGPLAAHPTRITLANIGDLPASVAGSLSAAMVTVTGLFRVPGVVGPNFTSSLGPPLVAALLVGIVIRFRTGPPPSPWFWAFLSMPLVYWALIALAAEDRVPELSRYQYPGAIFLFLFAAELVAGLRLGRAATVACVAVLAAATVPNLLNLHQGARVVRDNSESNRAELAAVELAGPGLSPQRLIEPLRATYTPDTDMVIAAGDYLDAADDFGSLAFSLDELRASGPVAREAADLTLAGQLGVELELAESDAPVITTGSGCSAATALSPLQLDLPPGGLDVGGISGETIVSLRRFGDAYSVRAGVLPARREATLRIPPDAAAEPWSVRVVANGKATACPA